MLSWMDTCCHKIRLVFTMTQIMEKPKANALLIFRHKSEHWQGSFILDLFDNRKSTASVELFRLSNRSIFSLWMSPYRNS